MSNKIMLPKGTRIRLFPENSPICKDNMFWWYGLPLDLDVHNAFWISEGRGSEYYLEAITIK